MCAITADELRVIFKDNVEPHMEFFNDVFSDYRVCQRVRDWFNNDCKLIMIKYEDAFVRDNREINYLDSRGRAYVDKTYFDNCEKELDQRFEYFGELLGFLEGPPGAKKLIPNGNYFKHKRELKQQ